ncbi:MAG: DUF2147 domain-containing protein [Betaproteobacteria bacterium]|nr:DUF2147 domain-containing protein [Betaproteobacteria bacterium]
MRMRILLLIALGLISTLAVAAENPVGLWRTIDDKSGKEKSLVRVTESNGQLQLTIEKIFREPGEDPNPLCDKCPGEKKNKPVIGMQIGNGLKKDGDVWSGGEILDPQNGKTYKCKVWLEDKGKKLNVRGFIGVSVLGRTQVWLREE